jgi:hypothetical protein
VPLRRHGLETAILDCLSQSRVAPAGRCAAGAAEDAQGAAKVPPLPLPLLMPGHHELGPLGEGGPADAVGGSVLVNALISETDPTAAAAAARALVTQGGYQTLKIKVARRWEE